MGRVFLFLCSKRGTTCRSAATVTIKLWWFNQADWSSQTWANGHPKLCNKINTDL